jgi:hypothetical protein
LQGLWETLLMGPGVNFASDDSPYRELFGRAAGDEAPE